MRNVTLYKKRQAKVDGYYVTFLSFCLKGARAPGSEAAISCRRCFLNGPSKAGEERGNPVDCSRGVFCSRLARLANDLVADPVIVIDMDSLKTAAMV